jgi:subtilisin family serine protease
MIRLFALSALLVSSVFAQVIPGRYIIELAGEPAATYASKRVERRAAAESERRAQIAAEQVVARRALESAGVRVIDSVDTVLNALMVEWAGDDAEALRRIPGVAAVHPDRKNRALLDYALSVHSAVEAWIRVGGIERAGRGARIAIIDTGIDATHPGFSDEAFLSPEGFPKLSKPENAPYVSDKIIVARSYEELSDPETYGENASDLNGHGTAAAMCAAGIPIDLTTGETIAGMAPAAYLGNYKALGADGGGASSAIIKAIEDAVRDGMDIINLSLGNDAAPDPEGDPQVRTVENAIAAGKIVVLAAGNAGPDLNTINSPATAPNGIAVGASLNAREFEDDAPVDTDYRGIAGFSSRGPNLGAGMKPDLVAVGASVLTAESTLVDESGLRVINGTSFSSPMVAGAAAVLRTVRPNLTTRQYRSLLINSAQPIVKDDLVPFIRSQGAGLLNMDNMVRAMIVVSPTSLKLGVGGPSPSLAQSFDLSNLAGETDQFNLRVIPFNEIAPTLSDSSVRLGANGSATVTLRFAASDLPVDDYQGYIQVRSSIGSPTAYIPYSYVVRSSVPASISLLNFTDEATAGEEVLLGVRVVEKSGVALDVLPQVVLASGAGSVLRVGRIADTPGVTGVLVRAGAGENVFRITAGDLTRVITITGN